MGSAGLKGNVELSQIKLGAGRVFQGLTPTVLFDGTAKFNTEAPAANWRDLGNVSNNASLNMVTDMFTLKNGIPSLAKKRFIIGRDGTLEITLNEFGAYVNQVALALAAPVNKLDATARTVSASPTPTASVFTLSSVAGLAAGDEIVSETVAGNLPSSNNRGIIDNIVGSQVTLEQPLFTAPISADTVKKVISTKLWFGGAALPTYPLLYVIDLTEGKQIVYYFPRTSVKGDYNPDTGNGTENMKLKLTFETYSANDTDAGTAILCAVYLFESLT